MTAHLALADQVVAQFHGAFRPRLRHSAIQAQQGYKVTWHLEARSAKASAQPAQRNSGWPSQQQTSQNGAIAEAQTVHRYVAGLAKRNPVEIRRVPGWPNASGAAGTMHDRMRIDRL